MGGLSDQTTAEITGALHDYFLYGQRPPKSVARLIGVDIDILEKTFMDLQPHLGDLTGYLPLLDQQYGTLSQSQYRAGLRQVVTSDGTDDCDQVIHVLMLKICHRKAKDPIDEAEINVFLSQIGHWVIWWRINTSQHLKVVKTPGETVDQIYDIMGDDYALPKESFRPPRCELNPVALQISDGLVGLFEKIRDDHRRNLKMIEGYVDKAHVHSKQF